MNKAKSARSSNMRRTRSPFYPDLNYASLWTLSEILCSCTAFKTCWPLVRFFIIDVMLSTQRYAQGCQKSFSTAIKVPCASSNPGYLSAPAYISQRSMLPLQTWRRCVHHLRIGSCRYGISPLDDKTLNLKVTSFPCHFCCGKSLLEARQQQAMCKKSHCITPGKSTKAAQDVPQIALLPNFTLCNVKTGRTASWQDSSCIPAWSEQPWQ